MDRDFIAGKEANQCRSKRIDRMGSDRLMQFVSSLEPGISLHPRTWMRYTDWMIIHLFIQLCIHSSAVEQYKFFGEFVASWWFHPLWKDQYIWLHNWLLTFQREDGSMPLASCHHHHNKLQLITFFPFNLIPTPLDHEDQRLWLKSEQPVMSDNLFTATAAHQLSNTYSLEVTILCFVFL